MADRHHRHGHPLRSGPRQALAERPYNIHWTLNLDCGRLSGLLPSGPPGWPRLQKLPRRGRCEGRDGGQLCRHRRRHLLAHQPHRRLRRSTSKNYLHLSLPPCWLRPCSCWRSHGEGRAAGRPTPPCQAVLRRLPGTPHGHPVLAEGVDGLDHPAVDTIPSARHPAMVAWWAWPCPSSPCAGSFTHFLAARHFPLVRPPLHLFQPCNPLTKPRRPNHTYGPAPNIF